jgi:hypothetical protein
MKKFTFLFSLLLTQFAFAQWDGDLPGDGTFPWLGDSIVVVNDTTFVINGDTISLGGNDWDENDNPWGGSGSDNPWGNDDWDDEDWGDGSWGDSIIVINDSTIVIGGDTITIPSDGTFPWDEDSNPWGGNDGDNPWDNDDWDDEDWGNGSWGDSIIVINDSTIVIGGDTITIPSDGTFPWDEDSNPWGGNDGDNPWDNEDDEDCPWEDGFPGGSEGEDFDEDTFEEMMEIIEGFDMEADELVLILENTDAILSILDESGFEFTPEEIDGYLVFGPFSIDDLYTIFIEGMEGFEIGWGLFRPMGAQIVGEGVITSTGQGLNNMFTVSSMLSLNETEANLEVYKTTYYDLLGKEVKDANNGVFIKVMQTNKGDISDKVYIAK